MKLHKDEHMLEIQTKKGHAIFTFRA